MSYGGLKDTMRWLLSDGLLHPHENSKEDLLALLWGQQHTNWFTVLKVILFLQPSDLCADQLNKNATWPQPCQISIVPPLF